MKIGLLLSIREKSTRFPHKVLKLLHGQTVTEHLVDRLKLAEHIDSIIIATSDDPRDKVFEEIANNKKINIYYGSQDDKLLRYYQVSQEYSLDAVIIVDGDDILCFPEVISKTAEILRLNNYDAIFWDGLPLGAASSGITKKALKKVIECKDENDTEVWGGYFVNERFKYVRLKHENDLFNHPEIRLTLDYEEDFHFIENIFNILYPDKHHFSSSDLMELLVKNSPELNEINKNAQIKYLQNIEKATPIKFKSETK